MAPFRGSGIAVRVQLRAVASLFAGRTTQLLFDGVAQHAETCFAELSLLHLTGVRKQLHAAWLKCFLTDMQRHCTALTRLNHCSLGSLLSLCVPADACEPAILPGIREGVWFASSAGYMLEHRLGYSRDE